MISEPTSMTLLGRLRRKEPTAWERFVALYGPLIRGWCRRCSIPETDTDDITQEVTAAVVAGVVGYTPQGESGSFRGWLRGITRHKIADWARRNRRDTPGEGGSVALARLNELPALEDTDEELAALHVRAAEGVRQDFAPATWQAFWRTVVDGVPAVEVAVELNLHPPAVRMAKARVLKRIREELGEVGS